ncbi:MAG TPA: hypothetical protein VK400_14520 [Pyrinomonadaceae bacterium]|nr:hypothetical protein [Pyrinomonadaceae bacterium]
MKTIKILLIAGVLLLIASFATCHFGVQYAISQIPPEIRTNMSDTDWIGVEWIGRGLLIFLGAVAALFSALILWLRCNKRKKLQNLESRIR